MRGRARSGRRVRHGFRRHTFRRNIARWREQGGSIFQLHGRSLETLYSFCAHANCSDGKYPAGVIGDGSGNLFGVTTTGGDGGGTVFELVYN